MIIPIQGKTLTASDVSAAMMAMNSGTGDIPANQAPHTPDLASLKQALDSVKPSGELRNGKHVTGSTPSLTIPSSLINEACHPIDHKYPPSVFNDFVAPFVKVRRDNPGYVHHEFDQRCHELSAIQRLCHLHRPTHKRSITGFTCEDLKSAVYQAQSLCTRLFSKCTNLSKSSCGKDSYRSYRHQSEKLDRLSPIQKLGHCL